MGILKRAAVKYSKKRFKMELTKLDLLDRSPVEPEILDVVDFMKHESLPATNYPEPSTRQDVELLCLGELPMEECNE